MIRPVHIDAERLLRRLRAARGGLTQEANAGCTAALNERDGMDDALRIVQDEMERAGQESES